MGSSFVTKHWLENNGNFNTELIKNYGINEFVIDNDIAKANIVNRRKQCILHFSFLPQIENIKQFFVISFNPDDVDSCDLIPGKEYPMFDSVSSDLMFNVSQGTIIGYKIKKFSWNAFD